MLREGAVEIVRTLARAGHQAVFAGGCVRDRLLGIEPVDYDIATSARPSRSKSCSSAPFRSDASTAS
jgi:tRNA nucleotidyltransferase/poly(A) polymerase